MRAAPRDRRSILVGRDGAGHHQKRSSLSLAHVQNASESGGPHTSSGTLPPTSHYSRMTTSSRHPYTASVRRPIYWRSPAGIVPAELSGVFLRALVGVLLLLLSVGPVGDVNAEPSASTQGMLSYRLFWLASERDAWTTSGLRDVSGDSGSFLGQQVEGRLRWNVKPENVRVELGGAYLVRGGFAKNAPSASGDSALFIYTQVTATI